jgi:hypothetical protein
MPHIANMPCFNGKEIIEWNLDGFVEYQIFTMCHQMVMYANACIANGNKEKRSSPYDCHRIFKATEGLVGSLPK